MFLFKKVVGGHCGSIKQGQETEVSEGTTHALSGIASGVTLSVEEFSSQESKTSTCGKGGEAKTTSEQQGQEHGIALKGVLQKVK
jgi:hypothetical protein